MAIQDLTRIEEKLDKVAAGATIVSDALGGVMFQNMAEVMEFSKLMSLSQSAVPKYLRGNPGACLAICVQAMEWRSSPFAVANKSYEVNDRIGYESQLVHAVIEQRAPILGRLRHKFDGEGDKRTCTVWATAKGEAEPLSYTSPEFGKITPKNSPLWKSKPDLQLYYNSSRDWCRVYFPDVLLGIYSEDELRDAQQGPDYAKDVTPKPNIAERLKGPGKSRGFSKEHVEAATAPATIEGKTVASRFAGTRISGGAGMRPRRRRPNDTPARRALLALFIDEERLAVNSYATAQAGNWLAFNDTIWRRNDSYTFRICKQARDLLGLKPFKYRRKTWTWFDIRDAADRIR